MSSGNDYERMFRLWTSVCKLIVDGKRWPSDVIDVLQKIVDGPPPVLLVDLGIVEVPDDYNHATALETFRQRHVQNFSHLDQYITDVNFRHPTRVLEPGDKFNVRAFKPGVPGFTCSEKRMAFLATQDAIYTGAQGACLVWEQKRDQLLKGHRYFSYDLKERLWKSPTTENHGLPGLMAIHGYSFDFRLVAFESEYLSDSDAFLCFTEVKDEGEVPEAV